MKTIPTSVILSCLVLLACCAGTHKSTQAALLLGNLSLDEGSELIMQVAGTGAPTTVPAAFGGTFSVAIETATDATNGEIPVSLAITSTSVSLDETDEFTVSLGILGTASGTIEDLTLSGDLAEAEGDVAGGTGPGTNTFDLSGDNTSEQLSLDQATVNILSSTGFISSLLGTLPLSVDIFNDPVSVLSGTTVTLTPTGTPGEFDITMAIQLDWDIVSSVSLASTESLEETEEPGPFDDVEEIGTLYASGTLSVVPEPATWSMAAIGLFALVVLPPLRRKR